MKTTQLFTLITWAILTPSPYNKLNAQQEGKVISVGTEYVPCASFHISPPLREISTESVSMDPKANPAPKHFNQPSSIPNTSVDTETYDPVTQSSPGLKVLDTLMVNIDGGKNARPDATGAAGPNHYVQGVNPCNFQVINKQGQTLLTTSMNAIAGSCSGDPIVVYDKFADRWLLTSETHNFTALTIAVSTTPDPTGPYYVYTYTFTVMPDYPKYSVWPDGYYATFKNLFLDTVGIGVFDRARMLKGDPTAGMIKVKFPNGKVINANNQMSGAPKILDCDGALPPYGRPNYLMHYTNTNSGDASNSIMIYQLNTDTALKKCTLSLIDSLPTAPFNAYFSGAGGGAVISQPGATAWPLDGTFQYRVPYIRFIGFNSVVLCNTVNMGNYRAGIRWYELRQDETTLKWSIHQQGTFAPSDGLNRWNGSIGMDLNGAISLAYNVSSSGLYPAIRYTGRLASDPLGQMTLAERTVHSGNRSFQYQWGDYSQTSLDPDGITFWHTNQYITDPSGAVANTRICSFRLSNTLTTGTEEPSLFTNTELTVHQDASIIHINIKGTPNNDPIAIELFDIQGKLLHSISKTPDAGATSCSFQVDHSPGCVILIRSGNLNWQKVGKVVMK